VNPATVRIFTGAGRTPWPKNALRERLGTLLLDLRSDLRVSNGDLSRLLDSPFSDAFFAIDNDELVGYAELHEWRSATGPAGYIENVVVRTPHQGKGIGTALMRALLRAADRRKLRSIHLHTSAWRTGAQALYKSMGFSSKGTTVLIKDL
jgi:ribosomal protein S18 acetylase RimI-like enzyme